MTFSFIGFHNWTFCVFEQVIPLACVPLTIVGWWAFDQRGMEECKIEMDSHPEMSERIGSCIDQSL